MTGFVGWAGLKAISGQVSETLSSMSAAAGLAGATPVAQGAGYAIAVSNGVYPVSHFSEDDFCAVIMGRPRWLDSRLAEKARQENDAAAVAVAWRESGYGLLQKLEGNFSLVVVDGGKVLAAIDRFGIHALSYSVVEGGLVFSSHAGAVAAHPAVGSELDPQALFNYFHFHAIPSPRTIYRLVSKLQPAEALRVEPSGFRTDFYFHHRYAEENTAPFEAKRQSMQKLLEQSVARHLNGQRSAAFLSGGLDSSTVSGYLAKLQGNTAETYSIGFEQQGFDEMEYVRIAAKQFNLNSHEYYLQPQDIVEAIPVIARAYDEPFANNSAVPTYFCARKAHGDGFARMFAGDGGDEIFGGNARYAKQMLFERYFMLPPWARKGMIEPMAFNIPFAEKLMPLRKLQSYIRQANVPLPDRLETYNFLHRQPLSDLFEQDFLARIDPDAPVAALRDTYLDTDSPHPINRMLHLDMKFTLADNDLRKVTRMAEAAGVEVVFPMLDDDLVRFSCGLPTSDKVKGQQLRWFYKKSLEGFLPDAIINKSKHGFGLPFGPWALSHPPLKEWTNDRLDAFSRRGWVRASYIQSLRKLHAEVHPVYYGSMVWLLAILEEWLQTRKL